MNIRLPSGERNDTWYSTVAHLPCACFIKDRDGRYRSVNPAAARIYELSVDEIQNRTDAELFDDVTAALARVKDQQVMTEGETVTFETFFWSRHDGTPRVLLIIEDPYRDERGQIIGVIGVCCDVTRQRQEEEEQRASARSARCLLWYADVTEGPDKLIWKGRVLSEEAARVFLSISIPSGRDYVSGLFLNRIPGQSLRMREYAAENIRANRSYSQEYRVLSVGSGVRWLREEVRLEPIAPGIWRTFGVTWDITEEKQRQDAHLAAMRSARCLIWYADIQDKKTIYDEEMTWHIRVLSEEAARDFLPIPIEPGQYYTDALYRSRLPEETQRANDVAVVNLRANQSYSQEFRVRTVDGEIHWLHEDVYVEPVSEGAWRAVGVCTDITERKRAEEATHYVTQSARCLLWHADVTDRNGEYLHWDIDAISEETAQEFLPLDVVGDRGYFEAMDQRRLMEDRERIWHNAVTHIRAGKDYSQDYRCCDKFGNIRWLHEDVHVETIETGKWRCVGVCTDVTELKRVEEAAETARDVANAANRAKSEFLANMSHEIRTPMNGVLGMTQLLAYTELNAEQKDYVETLKQSAESLLVVIDDILDFSKIEAGKIKLRPVDYDLQAVIVEVLALMEPTAQKKGLAVAVHFPENIPASVYGDPGRLRQVLLNLVGNAIKFTNKGAVSVNCELLEKNPKGIRVRLAVKDTGMGISCPDQKLLFQSFSQVDTSHTRRFGGTGLGLAISKQLIELMGGAIGVDSTPGSGSTFWIELPLQWSGAGVLPAIASLKLPVTSAILLRPDQM